MKSAENIKEMKLIFNLIITGPASGGLEQVLTGSER
jgi:hypothetical protein